MTKNTISHLIFFMLLIPFSANAQSGKYSYIERDSNREEGFTNTPKSGKDLYITSFMKYQEQVMYKESSILKIRFYLSSPDNVFITATQLERQGESHYQMRPIQKEWNSGWQEFSYWPVKDVLKPQRIYPKNLGIIARQAKDIPGSGEIVPVILYETSIPAELDDYHAYLLPKNSLSKVKYFVVRKLDGKVVVPEERLKNLPANSPFKASFSLKGQPSGKYILMVKTEELGYTVGPDRSYTFYHY